MIGGLGIGTKVLAGIPVDPDAPEARLWLREELAKAPYQAARPTWFDRLSQAILDWFGSLVAPSGAGLAGWVPLIVTIIIAAVLAALFLIFGLPRLNRRSSLATELFGVNDRRTAADLRTAALAAASHREWNLAGEEMFRALARGLFERTILMTTPGTTAHAVAERAAEAFPGDRVRLATAADVFDGLRYLGQVGTEEGFLALAALESDLRGAAPVRREDPVPLVRP
ncbi:DUF4129 domain-containing protein [Cryobacterium algoritolerans]|uniref:DUF4129 domain-containing protein n=1 Tax=Cryobacterium algoritolerans TaxID=1259184 RepID=A0A4R8WXD6_9MICO|nr:DUF4129 domain-containing protein [Cryobacterium algoritolerans]TFC19533.1 DUF4129 domain-containing protein [Cryobacterium algoritolerans]